MEILELNYTMTKIKTYWINLIKNGNDGERISKLEEWSTEIILSEQQRSFLKVFF